MIGVIIVGGLAAMGIASIARRHSRWHHAWHHGGWGRGWHHGLHGWDHGGGHGPCGGWVGRHHDHDGRGGGPWGPGESAQDDEPGMWMGGPGHGFNPLRFRRGRRWLMRGLFRRLETTPTQQQALQAAAEEFQESAKQWKGEAGRTRTDIAAALRRPAIDAESMGELFARHDTALEGVRKAFVGLSIKVHDVLDADQRERLARLIEAGPRGLRHDLRHQMRDDMSGGW
jgi:hypothetical protein